MNYKTLILIYIYCLIDFSIFAGDSGSLDNGELKFQNFSINEGLSQSTVLTIIQDDKGFLWFGTRDGLNKFDGYKFSIYRHNLEDSTSISNNRILSLFEDHDANLWIGTLNGLNKYDVSRNSFTNYCPGTEVWSIEGGSENSLLLGTDSGLIKFDLKNYTKINSAEANTIQESIKGIYKISSNQIWICTIHKIYVYNTEEDVFTEVSYPGDKPAEYNKNYVPVIYQDAQGNIWLGHTQGLAIYDAGIKGFRTFATKGNKKNEITDEVRSIVQDFKGYLWVGTYNGVYIIDLDKTSLKHLKHNENDNYSLSQNSIYKIFEDSRGDIWVGTYAGGVNYYDRSYDVFKNISAGSNNTKLNYKVVSSIVEDNKGNIWLGTEGGGLNYYNRKSRRFTYFTHQSDNKGSISSNNIKSMLLSHKGHFWIGTHDGGLNFFNPEIYPYQFIKFKNKPDDINSLSNDRVISLFEDIKGDIWIGTAGGGLNRFNVENNLFTRIPQIGDYVGNLIYSITPTVNDNVILVSGDRGLAKINIQTHDIAPIRYRSIEQWSNNVSHTLYAYEDSLQNIWICTEGSGLYYYDSATRKTTKYGMAQGLPNEVIYGVLPDDANSLWFSTNNGLSRFNLTSKKFNNFDASDGLLGNEFNFGAFTRLKNGHLVYGSVEGLNSFAPKGIVENSFIPSVAITALKVNNKPYYIDPDNVGELVLRHNQNVLNFEFVALSYSNADKNQYAYRLQGFDREWNYVKKNLGATYTNLDEGSYTFHVIASNNDKLWNEEGTKLRIRILPAPWKTWWAYLFYTGFIFGIVILIRRYTLIRIYERNQLKQERLEKERIEEVNALKLQLFTNISHDFRTPLTLIIGSLEQLLKEKSTNTFVKSQFEVMHRNANVLMQLINQLLDFRKSEFGKLKLSVSKGNLVFFIHEIKRAFEELAKVKQIEFQFVALDETIDGWFDKMHLKNVIFNLLSNAFKFTPVKGEITLQVSTKEQYKGGLAKQFAKIKIKDNGIGIAESKQKYIFDRFYHLGERTGTGIGLALTKNLVELHGGTIKVKSSESVGTCFTIILPLGQDHLTKDQFADDERYTEKANFIQTDDTVLIKSELMQYENQVISNEIIDNTSPSVLIVDDNVEVRALIKLFFKGTYNIYEAANGKSALELVQDKEIDIILSDVMMPIMDGIELCNQIKTNVITSHIPVVLLTAKSSQETQHSGYRLGADLYITKPFDINILELRIANLLKLRKRFADKFKKDIILEPKELTFTSTDELFLKNVIDIVNKNLTNPNFNMNELIDQMGVSRSVLYRKLKAITGQSASEFIKNMKLKRAAQLIMKSNMNISEIAFELGYSDLKHFRKSFKEKFNVLPSEYKHTPKDNIQ